MRQCGFALVVALTFSGCASLRYADGTLNVPMIISDARWGVLEACTVQWLQPDVCTITLDALTTADAVAAKNLPNTGAAVRQVLIDIVAKLSPTSRARPYLTAIIVILAAG